MNRNSKIILNLCVVVVIFIIVISAIMDMQEDSVKTQDIQKSNKAFKIISSTENKDIEEVLTKYAEQNNINIEIEYAGTIEIMEKLNAGEEYDAVWCSNSIWLYMLDENIAIKNSKSTSINPVVFGITKTKAQELGFIGKDVYMNDILDAIKQGKLKYSMSTPTQTNTGATAYLGFLSTLAGNPEVLTEKQLEEEKLKTELTELYSGTTRSSGDEEFLEEMFLNGNYEAIITYEKSLININEKLEREQKEPLYAIYPKDGVSISDSPFAYIDNKKVEKLEEFEKLQSYILSKEGQNELVKTGRRVWFGGTNENADKTIFNPNWGIDTTKYIVPVKYPSTAVIKQAFKIYQTELRKPIHIVFCLDYSGSMYGTGNKQLTEAMNYILSEEKASKDLLQFSKKDKITVIPFNNNIMGTYQTKNGTDTTELIETINKLLATGGTDIYTPAVEALNILDKENLNEYNASIVLMTDGQSTDKYKQLEKEYKNKNRDIPIFSIMFGAASKTQLQNIADLTNARVFDGKTNLLEAFKQVRGYN